MSYQDPLRANDNQGAESAMTERASILLMEDNQLLRWCMARSLSRAGFNVVAPSTEEEAQRAIAAGGFDALVTDWRLCDGCDGFKVLAAVRRSCPWIVSILMSADVDAELARLGRIAGFDRVVQKPLSLDDVVAALEASCRCYDELEPAVLAYASLPAVDVFATL
jgi:DNA-binding response OmpR family regulator